MSDAQTPANEAAKAKGLVVVWPEPDQLFVDIDSHAALVLFEAHILTLKSVVPCTWMVMRSPSEKPGHWHATVRLSRPVEDVFERILLQALLGSDLLHEILSWKQATAGNATPTCFFEKPERVEAIGVQATKLGGTHAIALEEILP
jgi:hypothetical protein